MRMKRTLFSIVLLAAFAVQGLYAQATREEIFNDIATTGGVYYAYPGPSGVQTKAPKGYEPFYISHYGRHGSRWLIADEDYVRVMEVFEKAHAAGALTDLGEDVRKRLDIVWADAKGHGGDLSPVGVKQQRGIAERMYQAFPEVFKGEPQMSARSTVVIRCVLSMDAFCERLKEFNPKMRIERESSNKYMDYATMRKLQIFVDVLELYYNAGRFKYTIINLIKQYNQDAYTFFADFAQYWQAKKLHLAPHAPKNLYVFLYDFIEQNSKIKDKEYIYNVLKFDALLTDKGKIKIDMLPWKEVDKKVTDDFYMSEKALAYINNYQFKSWRDLKKKFSIEVFAYDMNEAKSCQIKAKENAMIFAYEDDGVFYQEIKQGDINL